MTSPKTRRAPCPASTTPYHLTVSSLHCCYVCHTAATRAYTQTHTDSVRLYLWRLKRASCDTIFRKRVPPQSCFRSLVCTFARTQKCDPRSGAGTVPVAISISRSLRLALSCPITLARLLLLVFSRSRAHSRCQLCVPPTVAPSSCTPSIAVTFGRSGPSQHTQHTRKARGRPAIRSIAHQSDRHLALHCAHARVYVRARDFAPHFLLVSRF